MPYVDLTGYRLTFDAEFTNSDDMRQFSTSYPWGGRTLEANHEAQNYADAGPFSVSNGALHITATPHPGPDGLTYQSGMITTADTFSQNGGFFCIGLWTTGIPGFWPAFWMLPDGGGWPELDVIEQANNGGADAYFSSVKSPGGTAGAYYQSPVPDLAAGFHVYGMLWDVNHVQMYCDSQPIGPAYAAPGITSDMYLIANMAVGGAGSWPGQPASGVSADMAIDFIRAYSNDGNVPATDYDKRLLRLSFTEDAWNGDARAQVSVDGRDLGTFDIPGQRTLEFFQGFDAGPHDLAVSFVNDAWGGPGADRNLHLTGGYYSGAAHPEIAADFWSNGTAHFTLHA